MDGQKAADAGKGKLFTVPSRTTVPQPTRLMQALADVIDGKLESLSNDWDVQ
jgi:hypothetical protein